ncbi:MAG: copper amine oxidase N-terminal domain-containing protein, partial [Clostridiales bacterium]|nr:copper amine oxidase N-terminal domain-containing protein [Clostridiales bacterium]
MLKKLQFIFAIAAILCISTNVVHVAGSEVIIPKDGSSYVVMRVNSRYMNVNGEVLEIDPGRVTVPMLVNNRTMIPARALLESMGGQVDWDEATKQISLKVNDKVIIMTLNQSVYFASGAENTMDVAPFERNGRTYVPLRFASEALGSKVYWYPNKQEILVSFNAPYIGATAYSATARPTVRPTSAPIPTSTLIPISTPKPTPKPTPTWNNLVSPTLAPNFSNPASTAGSWTKIKIEGDAVFTKNTQDALDLIEEKSIASYKMVTKYIGIIRQSSYSGMAANYSPPTYLVGETANSETVWYASTIVHDSYHSKLYHDYLAQHGNVPDDIWMGATAEGQCLEIQIAFLEEIGA